MILKPIAKPVKIRIKSGGIEHSSLESLKAHFVLDDVKELIHDGRLSRWLQQQNHDAIPENILEMDKESMEFSFALYRFFFDEENEKSIGEISFILFCDTKNDDFLFRSVEESYPKALLELESRRKKAEEEARIKAEEEARRKAAEEEARRKDVEEAKHELAEIIRMVEAAAMRKVEEEVRKKKEVYIMIGENRYVELYKDCRIQSTWEKIILSQVSDSSRLLTYNEWQYLVSHIDFAHPFYQKYLKPSYENVFIYKTSNSIYETGRVSHGKFTNSYEYKKTDIKSGIFKSSNVIQSPVMNEGKGLLLLFKDVEI